MRNKKIENLIKLEVSTEVPDVLDKVLKNVGERKFEMKKNEKRTNFPLRSVLSFASIALLAIAIGIFTLNRGNGSDATVLFDVNPSIEIKVNSKNKVMGANALNVDGKKILKDMNLVDSDLNIAVNAIIGAMYKNGYISDAKNSVLVTVDSKDNSLKERIQQEVSEKINETLNVYNIESAVLTQDYKENNTTSKLANEYGISKGKVELIEKIVDSKLTNKNGKTYTFEDLVDLNINELNVILNAKNKTIDSVKSTGTASLKSYIGYDKAKEIALNDSKANASSISDYDIELDYEYGLMIYELDFNYNGQEYEYEINALTGEIINKYVEIDDDYKKVNNTTNTNKNTTTTKSNYIGRNKAKSIALSNAGVSESNIRDLSIELDRENGRMVYEVDFESGNKDYEYEIDATSGKIIHKQVEIDD